MDQACRWIIKYFSCLLGNAVLSGPTWITQSSQQRFVSAWRRRLSACVQAGDGHFEHHAGWRWAF